MTQHVWLLCAAEWGAGYCNNTAVRKDMLPFAAPTLGLYGLCISGCAGILDASRGDKEVMVKVEGNCMGGSYPLPVDGGCCSRCLLVSCPGEALLLSSRDVLLPSAQLQHPAGRNRGREKRERSIEDRGSDRA